MPTANWMVQVPINDLMELMQMKDSFERMKEENSQLRREMEGLRLLQSETMTVVGDLRKSLRAVL